MESKETLVEVELRWLERLRTQSIVRNFDPIYMDDKKKGDNTAPSPIEMFLSSIGSCLVMSFVYCTYVSRIDLNPDDIRVKVVGKIKRVNDRLRLTEVHAEFIVRGKDKTVKIQKCFEKFQPFCILSESIKSKIPFSCNLKLVE